MLYAIRIFLLRDLRDHLPRVYSPLFLIVTTFFELAIYFYTAKAFSQSFEDTLGKLDYFSYVILGEICLTIPAALFVAIPRALQFAVIEGRMNRFLSEPYGPHLPLTLSLIAQLPRHLIHIFLYLTIGALFFSLSYPLEFLLRAALLQLCAWPIFVGLSFLGASLFLAFGRGAAAMGHLQTLFAVLAGTYFPLSVLPEILQNLSRLGSPFTLLLEGTRSLQQNPEILWPTAFSLLAWSSLTVLIGLTCFLISLNYVRKSGKALNIVY